MSKRQRDTDSITDSTDSTDSTDELAVETLKDKLDKTNVKLQKILHVLRMIDDSSVFAETTIRHMIKFTLDELDDLE